LLERVLPLVASLLSEALPEGRNAAKHMIGNIMREGSRGSPAEAERIERLESTFQAIASGVADLESITREVEGSAELPAAVKQQVAWNLRKMTADASKLRSDALDAPQRDALRRALELRFSVLLSPAFWEQAVDRELLVS